MEKLVKKLTQQPQGTVHAAGASGGKSPDERLLRRLGSDLAIVKKRLDEIAPPKDPGALMMMREGDHAMLAGKPLQGYRQAGICKKHFYYAFLFSNPMQSVYDVKCDAGNDFSQKFISFKYPGDIANDRFSILFQDG